MSTTLTSLAILAGCVLGVSLARHIGIGRRAWQELSIQGMAALAFVAGFALAQGGRLTGDFFSSGLWGHGALILGAAWLVGLGELFAWASRARLPLAAYLSTAIPGLAGIAVWRGNWLAAATLLSGAVAAFWLTRTARAWPNPSFAWRRIGFAAGGLAMIAEIGRSAHVPFSAWWVVFFLLLLDVLGTAIRGAWSRLAGLPKSKALTYHQRLCQRGWMPEQADRLYQWGAMGLGWLAIGHYTGWLGVHPFLIMLAGLAIGLEVGIGRQERPPRRVNWQAVEWAFVALLLFASASRTINVLHQGFLTWDESRYAVLARDFLVSHDLGWTGVRPLYILLLSGAYAAWGANDSIGGYASVLSGITGIALTYVWARRVFDRQTALAAATLLTVSIFHHWYSRLQNSLALMMTLVALAGYLHGRSFSERHPWTSLALAGAALGSAFSAHYAMLIAIPFWFVAEILGTHDNWRTRLLRPTALGMGLAAAILIWVILMPPGNGRLPSLLYHSKIPIGCCFIDDVMTILLDKGPGSGRGDGWYYARAFLAFEGWPAVLILAAAALAALLRSGRAGEWPLRYVLLTTLGPLAFLSLTAAAGGLVVTRPLAVAVPGMALLGGWALAQAAKALPVAWPRAWRDAAFAAGLTVILLVGTAWAFPLRSMTSPYAAAKRWLIDHGMTNLIVFKPSGEINGYAWKFYFGEAAWFASSEAEAVRLCAEARPEYLVMSAEERLNSLHAPTVSQFDNPLYSTIPRLYEQVFFARYVGQTLEVPEGHSTLEIRDVRRCAE